MNEFVLDAYAARSCPVKTYNLFNPSASRLGRPDESLAEAFAGGHTFKQEILESLARRTDVLDLRGGNDWETREAEAGAAMDAGVSIIIDAVLPLDRLNHRSGRPDLLVRGADTAEGNPGYHPISIKYHRALERRAKATGQLVSDLDSDPLLGARELPEWTYRASRDATLLQLAHYWRMLEAAGRAATGPTFAGVIGLDRNASFNLGHVITWVNLQDKLLRTFSRTSEVGWKLRSPLERYDHEHRFRVYVANVAMQRTADDHCPPPVVPIVVRECEHCVWWEHCRSQLDDEAISLRINKAPLDVREISALTSMGITTIRDLAEVHLETLLGDYLPQVRHREGAESRVRLAARRAALLVQGLDFERTTTGPIRIPRAELEIDFDIETAVDGRTYLWGLLLTDHAQGQVTYRAHVAFEDLTASTELTLFEEFAEHLTGLLRGSDALVYHYSDYERVFMNRLAQRSTDPAVEELLTTFSDRFVDLFPIVKEHFFGTFGLGLKTMARAGAGFTWRDDDPGGLNSQSWFNEAVHGATEAERQGAQVRLLEYNEDDVQATKALRDWLHTQQ